MLAESLCASEVMVSINWFHVGRQDPKAKANPFHPRDDTFFPFPNAEAVDPRELAIAGLVLRGMSEAIAFLSNKVKVHKPCNDCFRRLPGKRSFQELWDDPDVWIHYNGASTSLGFHRPGTKDIAVCFKSFMSPPGQPGKPNSMQVAATIVHELAHVNGAEGDPAKRDNSAENSLRFCLLTQMFNPDVFGAIDRQREENREDPRHILV
jgi:hypothetical protein